MKTIPQIREEFLKLTSETANIDIGTSRKIKSLVKDMYRRSPIRRAGVEHVPVTAKLAAAVRRTARQNPDISYATLGRLYKVATGRISEILAGKRAA